MLIYVLPVKVSKKNKNLIIFIATIIICQVVDYIAYGYFYYELNAKIVFGNFLNNGFSIIISIVGVALISYMIIKRHKDSVLYVLILSAAAISNIIDRLIYGGVVDYFKNLFLPTINLADLVISTIILIIGIKTIKFKKP